MKISDVKVGTELALPTGPKYRATKISGDEISMESVKIVASMDIQLADLPVISEGVER